jgi:hypothetical protein
MTGRRTRLRDHRADWPSSAPASRVGSGGLALFVQRGGVVALTDSTAAVRQRPAATLTYRREDQSGALLASEVK